jgi:hypothetical protein
MAVNPTRFKKDEDGTVTLEGTVAVPPDKVGDGRGLVVLTLRRATDRLPRASSKLMPSAEGAS